MKVKMTLISFSLLFSMNYLLANVPDCLTRGHVLPIDNDQVLVWKSSTKSGFQSRAHIKGKLTKVYPDKTGHYHVGVAIGSHPKDTVEVIYNISFGRIPVMKVNDTIEACGDYITSTSSNGGYPPSPEGAIVHWVHQSNSANHDSGFVVVNGVLYGGH